MNFELFFSFLQLDNHYSHDVNNIAAFDQQIDEIQNEEQQVIESFIVPEGH
jgi:hypothetical protein